MSRVPLLTLLGVVLTLAGCAGVKPQTLPSGAAAYQAVPAPPETPPAPEARALRPGDVISVSVFREPDLGAAKTVVDEVGKIQLPLLGQVDAAGRTPPELARTLETRLGQRYLRNPKVTVSLDAALPRTVTVEGQVAQPGVFPLGLHETLLSSLARAGSPTQLAKLDQVIVFRTVNGQRMGGVFDVRQIRAGNAPDPQILDGDLVVVGYSSVRGAFRDFLSVTPLLNLFTVF